MAELNTPEPKKGDGKVRGKKMNSKVDLTAMVDLAFLLITFFMLTTTLAKPQSMSLAMPDKSAPNEKQTIVADTRTVTLLLGTNDQLIWYMGKLETPIAPPTVTGYGKDGLRQVLLDKNKLVLSQTQDLEKGLIVIIKPSDKAKYHNVIDALDEMAITGIKTYAIVDISKVEIELLTKFGLYQ